MKILGLLVFCGMAALPQQVVLRAARLFDGRSEVLQTPGLVVVEAGRITGVGPSAVLKPGAKVIELGDATLLPGFMDAHVHLTGEIGQDSRQDTIDGMARTAAETALLGTKYLRATLHAGFTTVRNLGAGDFVDVAMRNAIARGAVEGPRILAASKSLGSIGGHCDPMNGVAPDFFGREPDWKDGVVSGAESARQAVRYNVKYGADVIKICATGGVLSRNNDVDSPQLTLDEIGAIIDEAHAKGKRVAAHAHGASGAKRAIRMGVDSIEHGSFLDEEALTLMKQKGTFYVPTLHAVWSLEERLKTGGVMDPRTQAKLKMASRRIGETFRSAAARGIRVAFGTDAGVGIHGTNAEEFVLMVKGGLKPIDALRAATSVDAELFGIAGDLGALEAGKIADVVAVPGNPLDDIAQTRHVFFVMKDGAVVKNSR
ncbi:MAG: amidohydrolase family protein [Bryobacterales bacterium]|nr:amidohydrolase family protein [Bryobacterales bacterium]